MGNAVRLGGLGGGELCFRVASRGSFMHGLGDALASVISKCDVKC